MKVEEYTKRVLEYLSYLKLLNRDIKYEDFYLFEDGTNMYDWFIKENKRTRKAKVFDKITEYFNNKNHTDIEKRMIQYIEAAREYGKPKPKKYLKFKDGESAYIWYKLLTEKIESLKCREEITFEEKLLIKEYETMQKIIDDFDPEMVKIREYKTIIKKLKRKPKESDNLKFYDGELVYPWIEKMDRRISRINKQNIKKSTKIYKDEFEKYLGISKYADKVEQYISKVNELGRNITYVDNYKFTDGTLMYGWFKHALKQFVKKEKENYTLTRSKTKEKKLFMKLLKALDEYLPYLNHRTDLDKYTEDGAYEERCHEVIFKMKELKRKLSQYDTDIYFNDGVIMYNWLVNQIEISKKDESELTEKQKMQMKHFKMVEKELENYSSKTIYIKRTKEYYDVIKKLNRNLNENDEIFFEDGVVMYFWYNKEYVKYNNDIDNPNISKDRKEMLDSFKLIVDEVERMKNHTDSLAKLNSFIRNLRKNNYNISEIKDTLSYKGDNLYDFYQKELVRYNNEDINNIDEDRREERLLLENIKYELENTYEMYIYYINEFKTKLKEEGRLITQVNDYKFKNGYSMYEWYINQKNIFKKLSQVNLDNISENDKKKMNMFFELEKEYEEIKKIENRQKLVVRTEAYIKKLKELGRKIKKEDNICFSNGLNMYDWFLYYDDVTDHERDIYYENTEMHMDQIHSLALLYDEIYNLEKHNM